MKKALFEITCKKCNANLLLYQYNYDYSEIEYEGDIEFNKWGGDGGSGYFELKCTKCDNKIYDN